MGTSRFGVRLGAVLMACALVGTACGDSDETVDDAVDEVVDDTTAETDTDTGGGTDTDTGAAPDGGALATEGVVELAEGVSVDLDECPDAWSATTGADGDQIRIATSMPRSGQLAAFGAIADGIQAYFDRVNATDPIDGKEVVLEIRDDAYEAGRTVANVEELLETGDVFGFVSIIGTPNNLAIRETLDDACVPQLLNGTGAPNWGNPAEYPWTVGFQIAYNTEALLWCENFAEEMGEGATVAGIFMNNDFGRAYQVAVEQCDADGTIDLVANEVYEATAPDITAEMTNMVNTGADGFFAGTTAAFCPQAVSAVAQSTWRPLFYMSGTCANLASFIEPVKADAETIADEGSAVRMASYTKNFTDPTYADDPAIQEGVAILEDAGLSAAAGSQSTGVLFAYTLEQILRDAVEEYGGMNRVAVMAATWNQDAANPYMLEGVTNVTDGVNDAFVTEGARIEEIIVDDDGSLTFNPITDLISLEGETGSFDG